jgi:D-inositol-3-phosphate glycosyltransferase
MAQADMFVMPSFFEAFGCVYVEAMSCGTLTCGCNNSGAAEIIADGVDGLLVEEKSSKDIADRILWAIENPEQAAVMAQKGKKKAEQFSWDASAKALVDVYKQYVKASTAV